MLDRWVLGATNLIVAAWLAAGAACFVLLQGEGGFVTATLGAILFGLGIGANEMLWINLTKRQFGTRLFAYTYGGWSFAIAIGYAAGGGIGGWAFDNLDKSIFPLVVLMFYVPSLIVAVLRPGKENRPC